MAFLGYLVTVGLVLAGAQGCCLPEQWEGSVGLVEGYAATTGPTRGSLSGLEVIHYDRRNNRIAAEANLYNNGVHSFVKVIQDYSKKIQYTIQNNTCLTSPLEQFPQSCFDTSKAFVYYLGGPNANLPVQSLTIQKEKVQYSISLTADNSNECVFVGVLQSGEVNGIGYMLTEGFMNTTTGIRDPSVFNVPTICRHTTMLKSGRLLHTSKSALNVLGL